MGAGYKTTLSVILILQSISSQEMVRNAAVGTVELFYSNPDNVLSNGQYCDFILFGKDCEVFFDICIGSTIGDCSVLKMRTEIFKEKRRIELSGNSAIPFVIKQPVPESLYVSITAYDSDSNSAPDLIGHYEANVSVSSRDFFTTFPTDSGKNSKKSASLDLRVKIECLENFYGWQCQIYCKSDGLTYRCSPTGERICFEGFSGNYCNETDICTRETCAPGAVCVPKLLGRTCICNGADRPECYPNDDPCRNSPCHNGGICDRSSTNPRGFVCTCPTYYSGVYCDERISICALMEAEETAAKDHVSKMVYEESGGELMYNNFTTGACLNGGVCIDHPMKFAYLCSCPQGWTGSHCETKVFEGSSLITGLVCGLLSLMIIVGIIIYIFQRRKWKKRVSVLESRNPLVYETTMRPFSNSGNFTVSTDAYSIVMPPEFRRSYESVVPFLGDSLSIHRQQVDDSANEEGPPLPERTPRMSNKVDV